MKYSHLHRLCMDTITLLDVGHGVTPVGMYLVHLMRVTVPHLLNFQWYICSGVDSTNKGSKGALKACVLNLFMWQQ